MACATNGFMLNCITAIIAASLDQIGHDCSLPASLTLWLDPGMQMNYNNKDNLVGALIIAGYDSHNGGQVFGCPIGGTLSNEKWAIDGSGSTYIWGYCDEAFRCEKGKKSRATALSQASTICNAICAGHDVGLGRNCVAGCGVPRAQPYCSVGPCF